LRIHHSAIVDNVVTYVCAKFGDDRLGNEKALALLQMANLVTTTTRTTLVAIGDPFLGPKKLLDSDS